jgi:hypothetical protein
MKIYKDKSYNERLYEVFLDIELNGQLKIHKLNFGPNPIDSDFHHVFMTVCKNSKFDIRLAVNDDYTQVKKIANQHRQYLPFVMPGGFRRISRKP